MSENRQPNLLSDPIPSIVRYIAIPASIGTIFTTLYNFVDTYWAGQLSTESLAALTPNFTIYLLVLSIGIGFSSGTNALISNYIGSKQEDKSRYIFAQAIGYAVSLQIIVSVILMFLLKPLFLLMGTEPEVLPRALAYGRVIASGGIAMTLNQVFNSGLASRGISKPFRNSLIIGFFLNVALDPIFMFGVDISGRVIIPRLEETGIALATILIQAITASYLLYHVTKIKALKGMRFKDFIPRLSTLKEISSQVIPAMTSFVIMALGTLVINFFIGRYGKVVMAAYGTALRIEQFALIPNFGLMFALSAIVGQNNGAGNIDRIKKSFQITLRYGVYIMIALLTPVLIFGRQLLALISSDPDVIRIGYEYILIQGITFYSYIIIFQANAVLQSLKKPSMIMWVSIYRQALAPALIFPLLSFVLGMNERGVWWGLVIANWTSAILTLWWALRQIRKLQSSPRKQTEDMQTSLSQ